jgi:hypothetical protein
MTPRRGPPLPRPTCGALRARGAAPHSPLLRARGPLAHLLSSGRIGLPPARGQKPHKLVGPSGPEGGGASTSQGHPYAVFQRALKRRNVLSALAAAKDLPQLDLLDSLELTVLVPRKDPGRHQRMAARWLLRYLEEDPHATIDQAVLAASSLVALTGIAHQEAEQSLRAMAERATSRRTSMRGEVQRLAPEPCPAPDTEPSLQGLVFLSILPCCP